MPFRRGAGPRASARPYTSGMHGMASAAILICVFGAIAAVCLYASVRVYLAGGRGGGAS